MRMYEAVYILDPALEEAQQAALIERFNTLLEGQGARIEHLERWERRRLAYEVKGRREGYYVVTNFGGTPAAEAELARVLGITDGVLRHLIVRMDDRIAARAIAEAKAAAEARAKAQEEAAVRQAELAAAQAAAQAEAQARAAAAPAAPAAPAEEADPEEDTVSAEDAEE